MENELANHILEMEKRLFGLTKRNVRRLAVEIAERCEERHPFRNGIAGEDWMKGFLKRHPEITLRKPEGVSLNRALAFNKEAVGTFFSVYRQVMHDKSFQPFHVWKMDETGVTTVPQSSMRILTGKGRRAVGKLTSGERGRTVTVVTCMSAGGSFVHPMIIWPRKRMNEALMKGASPGSVGACSASGWIDVDLFMDWLRHFQKHTHSSKDNPQLLLLDGHHSHKTMEAITFAKEHGIEMITFPPHCTHKLQPLDLSFFKAFKTAFAQAVQDYLTSHPGQTVTMFEMGEMIGKAYKGWQLQKKQSTASARRECGLWMRRYSQKKTSLPHSSLRIHTIHPCQARLPQLRWTRRYPCKNVKTSPPETSDALQKQEKTTKPQVRYAASSKRCRRFRRTCQQSAEERRVKVNT